MTVYIPNGYYLKARAIEGSAIANAPPHIREIWDYLLREANHKSVKYYGHTVERGQLFRSIEQIREALHWMVGWRKERYKKHLCENAMKWLVKAEMITTTKAIRGNLITIVNYSTYQNPDNYESRSEDDRKADVMPTVYGAINKNDKNVRKNKAIPEIDKARFRYLNDLSFSFEFGEYLKGRKKQATPRAIELSLISLHKYSLETAILMIQNSIKNGWEGIFELKNGESANITKPKDKQTIEMDRILNGG